MHIFFCFIGVVASSLFIFVLISRSSQNLHVNLRLSLASLSLAAWIACTQLLLIAVYRHVICDEHPAYILTKYEFSSLSQTLTQDNACNSLYEARWCAIARWIWAVNSLRWISSQCLRFPSRFPVVLSIYATLCGILILAVERTIATLKYKTYEVHGSRLVAVILIGAQVRPAAKFRSHMTESGNNTLNCWKHVRRCVFKTALHIILVGPDLATRQTRSQKKRKKEKQMEKMVR